MKFTKLTVKARIFTTTKNWLLGYFYMTIIGLLLEYNLHDSVIHKLFFLDPGCVNVWLCLGTKSTKALAM